MALTAAGWRAHLGIAGWHHEDGTTCPTTLAPAGRERLWCTEHQQFVFAPTWGQHWDDCPTCGLGCKQDGIWDDLCDVGRDLKDAATLPRRQPEYRDDADEAQEALYTAWEIIG